jgi:titin
LIEDQAWGNTIGPDNLVSGNLGPGVLLQGSAVLNIVKSNWIGINAAGTSALQNQYGVQIDDGANNNLIGGTTSGDANIISGNQFDGVEISGAGTDGNVILNNWIGVNSAGDASVANEVGVRITDGAQNNHVGQATSGNLISGNSYSGVWISGTGTNGNIVAANAIGTNNAGSSALQNDVGVSIGLGAQNNTIGGSGVGAGNVIAGNTQEGVRLWDTTTTGNTISGNHIGLDAAGSTAIPNGGDGLQVNSGAHHNTVGGDTIYERNIISGNSGYGIIMGDSGTDSNQIQGNFIGTDSTGMLARPNGNSGVALQDGAQFNLIGGLTATEGNVISGNEGQGILLSGSGTENNTISANLIGVDASGSFALGNDRNGIAILFGSASNTIGGATPGEGNIISGNDEEGIYLSESSSNTVQGNSIGTDARGVVSIGNGYRAVRVRNGSMDNVIGPDNIMAFNGFRGVSVEDPASTGNQITQNSIYSNSLGGIGIFGGAQNGIAAPFITSTTLSSVTVSGGSSCPSCTVEVFSNLVDERQGRTYLGSTTADGSGDWSLTVECISGNYLTATVTDITDGTSEFSSVFTSSVRCLFLPLIMK